MPRRPAKPTHFRGGRPACNAAAVGGASGDELLSAALAARAGLRADARTTAFRIVHGAGDGVPGLVIEQLGDVLVAQVHLGRLAMEEGAVRGLCQAAAQQLAARAVYRKVFPADRSATRPDLEQLHHDAHPWIGEPVEPEFPVLENGLRLLARPYDGFATGIFLEHRLNRQRIRELARGRRVLNAFAYTCGFTVAAALGGAASTVSVDVAGKALDWGRRNLEANGVALADHALVRADVFDYCRRAQRQQRTFDLIILDPPTLGRTRRPASVFSLAEDLDRLVAAVLPLLAADGLLLLCTNHRGTSHRRLEVAAQAAAGQAGRSVAVVARTKLPADFPGDPDYAKAVLLRL